MMKKLVFLLFSAWIAGFAFSQGDTLRGENIREVSNHVFGWLNPTKYKGRLLERSLTSNPMILQQVKGNYNQVFDAMNFLEIYSDLTLSYVDSTKILSNFAFVDSLFNFFYRTELTTNELEQPFSLVLQNMYTLDSNKIKNNIFTKVNNQLRTTQNQNDLYQSVLIKSCAVLEFESDNGYTRGKLVYNPNFISLSEDIDLLSIKINTGDGYKNFGPNNHKFAYNRNQDSIIAFAALKYKLNKKVYHDTLKFYLTLVTGNNKGLSPGVQDKDDEDGSDEDRWDDKYDWLGPEAGIQYRVAVKYGCNNYNGIRRPIIFVPPYRPIIQPKSMNGYYDQFSFKSLFEHLSSIGYDVIFIKEKPGNKSIEKGGAELAAFIKHINEQKHFNYPGEDWENVIIGFSAGGQHARYALMKLEKEHIETGAPHHHTRLYVPFDSPHWGANVPMFTQLVYREFAITQLPALLAFLSLTDDASRGMLMNHISGSSLDDSDDPDIYVDPYPHPDRVSLVATLNNDFIHDYTPINDLRKTFPAFSRNIAISTGNNDQNYNMEYGLQPGMLLFEQNTPTLSLFGLAHKDRGIYASKYDNGSYSFTRTDIYLVGFFIPVVIQNDYRTNHLPNWDLAQGGYKDDFYDKIPTGAVFLLRLGAMFLGTKNYEKHVSFLPMVSALGINPTTWENNNLFYNLKNEGLMYQNPFDIPGNKSEIYGYPHLGHPTDHFNITPFEAIFCDPQTYDHIKMQKSVDDDNLDDTYLVHLRNFIVEEVEADNVFLQNKRLFRNPLIVDPNFRYKAWYKAEKHILIGSHVTSKTDAGDYIVDKTARLVVYAGQSVMIKPGFHTENGAEFYAFIAGDDCQRPQLAIQGMQEADNSNSVKLNTLEAPVKDSENNILGEDERILVIPNPNDGKFTIFMKNGTSPSSAEIYDAFGNKLYVHTTESEFFDVSLKPGIYFLRFKDNSHTKFIVK